MCWDTGHGAQSSRRWRFMVKLSPGKLNAVVQYVQIRVANVSGRWCAAVLKFNVDVVQSQSCRAVECAARQAKQRSLQQLRSVAGLS